MKEKGLTLNDIPDLTGKTVIITGANSGLGFETTRAFAAKGAETIMACRSLSKATEAKEGVLADFPDSKLPIMELNLSDLESVRHFSSLFKDKYRKLDILVNNAGIMMSPYHLTVDGFEGQFGTNHLGHFTLTALLLDRIKAAPGARVVNVSSIAHKMGDMDFDNLMFENKKEYSPVKAYNRSKLANLLFTYELQRFFEKKEIDAISVAAHPGVAMTNLAQFMMNQKLLNLLKPLIGWLFQTAKEGARPQIMVASKPGVKGAEYYGPTGFKELWGEPGLVESTALSHNEIVAKKLWDISEGLCGVKFE